MGRKPKTTRPTAKDTDRSSAYEAVAAGRTRNLFPLSAARLDGGQSGAPPGYLRYWPVLSAGLVKSVSPRFACLLHRGTRVSGFAPTLIVESFATLPQSPA